MPLKPFPAPYGSFPATRPLMDRGEKMDEEEQPENFITEIYPSSFPRPFRSNKRKDRWVWSTLFSESIKYARNSTSTMSTSSATSMPTVTMPSLAYTPASKLTLNRLFMLSLDFYRLSFCCLHFLFLSCFEKNVDINEILVLKIGFSFGSLGSDQPRSILTIS